MTADLYARMHSPDHATRIAAWREYVAGGGSYADVILNPNGPADEQGDEDEG